MAIHIVDWKKAMTLVYQGHADVVDENYRSFNFNDWAELSAQMKDSPAGFVHTPTLKIAVPEIIRLTRYDKLPKTDVKFTRKNIYEHYKHTCCYCGVKFSTHDLNLDHVMPKSRGGKSDWANIVTSCIECNSRKDNRTPEEAGMKLLIKPSKPRWRGTVTLLNISSPMKFKKSWQNVIDSAYWNSELED